MSLGTQNGLIFQEKAMVGATNMRVGSGILLTIRNLIIII